MSSVFHVACSKEALIQHCVSKDYYPIATPIIREVTSLTIKRAIRLMASFGLENRPRPTEKDMSSVFLSIIHVGYMGVSRELPN